MEHKLKTWPEFFEAIYEGNKAFEIRKNDREYAVNDILNLQEYDPITGDYTGRFIKVEVTYIMADDNPFINIDGFVIMSISTFPF